MKTTHLIKDYQVSTDSIECVCGWSGKADDLKAHQKSAPPTDALPPQDTFGGIFQAERKVNNEYEEDFVRNDNSK